MNLAPSSVMKALAFLEDDPDLLLVMVFGSAASGKLRFDSDIDVAVYPRESLDSRKRQEIADEIAMATGRTVDFIDLSTADGALLRQILKSGEIVFSKKSSILGSLTERMLDWQEDFEPQLNELLETRMRHFTAPLHGA